MTQEVAIEMIKSMPHDFNVDDLVEKLNVIEKIEEAEKDIAEGKIIPHSEMQRLFEEWKK